MCRECSSVADLGFDLREIDNLNGCYHIGEYSFLRGATLCYANLRFVNLRSADLRDVDFEGADLFGADLRDANLEGACFVGADMSGVKILESQIKDLLAAIGVVVAESLQVGASV